MFKASTIIVAALILAAAVPAWALEPAQVVVVVNKNQDESIALGRFYCSVRKVPEGNLVALSLPVVDDMTPQEYDALLVRPLRQALQDRKLIDTVRCILTMRGVPFRVLDRPRDPNSLAMLEWYQAASTRGTQRMDEDMRLMELVAQPAPAKVTMLGDLYDRSQWFDAPTATTAPAAADAAAGERFWALAKNKLLEIHHLGAGPQATIAHRQWLALIYDAFGLEGLAEAVSLSPSEDNPTRADLESRGKEQATRIKQLVNAPPNAKNLAELEVAFRTIRGAWGLNQQVTQQLATQNIAGSKAAIDSELALLFWGDYGYDGPLTNPLHWGMQKNRAELEKAGGGRVLMVSRLDGPRIQHVMRMVLDSVAVEKTGLKGTFYIDAGSSPNGTEEYNKHFTALADIIRRTKIPYKIDNRPAVFEANECPDAALYVGWYSLQKYVPSFTWVKGAVGFHVASWEAVHLRDPNSREWVPQMIANHVAATIGATDEPFLHAFPFAEDFFALVVSGKVTVCEAYWRTVPHVSWRMMLIADPLYKPFAANPQPVTLPEGVLAGLE